MAPKMFYVLWISLLSKQLLVQGLSNNDYKFDVSARSNKMFPRDVEAVQSRRSHNPQSFPQEDFRLNPYSPASLNGRAKKQLLGLLDLMPVGSNSFAGEEKKWSDWSACTRSCGGGVAIRKRQCGTRFADSSSVVCQELETEHRLCNTQECPGKTADFRETQCAERNQRQFQSKTISWVPYSDDNPNKICELSCMDSGYHFYHTFGPVVDGTRCRPGMRDVCINGECVKVGCDFVINSNATEDACGVCGGDNSSCFHYQNVFDQLTKNADEGSYYNEVARIPTGATNIVVKDYTRNYLVLMEAGDQEKYIVNGNWIISWPGEYKTAGTVVNYKRHGEQETFDIMGPTKQDLHVMTLYLGDTPLIEYEYWIPNSLRPSTHGLGELREQKSFARIPEEDYYDLIANAGLDYDAVQPPTVPETTTTTTATTPTTVKSSTKSRNNVLQLGTTKKHGISKTKSAYCKSCKKSMNRKRHFCDSSFVIHARVISKRRLHQGRYVRYEVELLSTYKAEFKLMRREYVWVSASCCPKLRPYRHYLLMGRKVSIDVTDEYKLQDLDVMPQKTKRYETRLIVNYSDYWHPLRKSYDVKMAKMANRINCKRYRRIDSPKFRQHRLRNEA